MVRLHRSGTLGKRIDPTRADTRSLAGSARYRMALCTMLALYAFFAQLFTPFLPVPSTPQLASVA